MNFESTNIKDCYIIHPNIFQDERGWFMRVFCDELFFEIKKNIHIKQINHSFNNIKGTFKGMHYQTPPFAEEKLVRCISGAVADFTLDLRENSPTFLKHLKIELSAKNKSMIFIPKGVAHGFQTLENNTELIYHHTAEYNKDADQGLRYDDPRVKISLPLPISIISEKDKNFKLLTNNFNGLII